MIERALEKYDLAFSFYVDFGSESVYHLVTERKRSLEDCFIDERKRYFGTFLPFRAGIHEFICVDLVLEVILGASLQVFATSCLFG